MGVADGALHPAGEDVGVVERERRFGLHMEIDEERETGAAHAELLGREDTRNLPGDALDVRQQLGPRRAIHQVGERRTQDDDAVHRDHRRRDQRRPVVGLRDAGRERHGDTDRRGERGDCVGTVMPGVGTHRGALDFGADAQDGAKERLLDHDDAEQHEESERRRQVVRREDLAHRENDDPRRRADQQQADGCRGQRLRLAVAERIAVVRLTRRKPQTTPDDHGREDIGGRFDAVGDESVRMPDDTGEHLDDGENGVDQHPGLSGASAAFDPLGEVAAQEETTRARNRFGKK